MNQQLSRRTFLLGAATGLVITLAGCGSTARTPGDPVASGDVQFEASTAGTVDFRNPLVIPPLAPATVHGNQRSFTLVAQTGVSHFLPGQSTSTWGYNGALLGPTLRAHRGEEVIVNFRNDLDETTSVHWHGMHLPAAMDGGPHQSVGPGQTWQPYWTIAQPAATLWYHPHPHGATEQQVYQGLAGLFLIDDTISDGLALPNRYGVDDILVIVQDKVFNRAGELRLGERAETGLLGETILVNGTYAPYFTVTTTQVRLRILNGSTARIYHFGFSDERAFDLIATDGGLLAAPHRTTRIQLSPGERAEIVVAMAPNTVTTLRSFAPDLGTVLELVNAYGGQDRFDILQLRAAAQLQAAPDVPMTLAPLASLDARAATRTRTFRLDGRQINDQRMDMRRIDAVVTVGSTEIWDVFNQNLYPHNFHIHDVQFQILDIDASAPPPELAGWKDTVYLRPRTHYRLIMRFADYTTADLPYMYHCHLLWHEDNGMMGQFVVVEPGTAQTGELATHSCQDRHVCRTDAAPMQH